MFVLVHLFSYVNQFVFPKLLSTFIVVALMF